MGKQERQNSVLCKTEEGTVEDTMSSPTILEAFVWPHNRVWIQIEYDKSIVNKLIKWKQCTIIWHVDDLKISHADKNVIEDIANMLNTP